MMKARKSRADSTAHGAGQQASTRQTPRTTSTSGSRCPPSARSTRQQVVGAYGAHALGRVGELQAPATIQTPPVISRARRPIHCFTSTTLGPAPEPPLRTLSRVLTVNERLVWIDCEMTGLSLETDALVEVAALVTDFDLNVLGEGIDVLIKPPQAALDQMIDFVRNMHVSSGLLEELEGGTTMEDAEQQVLAYIKEHCPDGSRPPLGGNTVATDRSFLARDMPDARGLPALPQRRRLLDQGARPPLVSRAPTSRPRPSAATTGRSPTSRRASRSCATTARPSSCPQPGLDTARRARSRRGTPARSPGSAPIQNPRTDCPTLLIGLAPRARAMVGIAQLVERRLVVADVAGSSPVTHPKQSGPGSRGRGQGLGASDRAAPGPAPGS